MLMSNRNPAISALMALPSRWADRNSLKPCIRPAMAAGACIGAMLRRANRATSQKSRMSAGTMVDPPADSSATSSPAPIAVRASTADPTTIVASRSGSESCLAASATAATSAPCTVVPSARARRRSPAANSASSTSALMTGRDPSGWRYTAIDPGAGMAPGAGSDVERNGSSNASSGSSGGSGHSVPPAST